MKAKKIDWIIGITLFTIASIMAYCDRDRPIEPLDNSVSIEDFQLANDIADKQLETLETIEAHQAKYKQDLGIKERENHANNNNR